MLTEEGMSFSLALRPLLLYFLTAIWRKNTINQNTCSKIEALLMFDGMLYHKTFAYFQIDSMFVVIHMFSMSKGI